MTIKKKFFFLAFVVLFLLACEDEKNQQNHVDDTDSHATITNSTPTLHYTIVNIHKHDTSFFTEGLEFYKNQLFESSGGGLEGTPYPSAFGIVDMQTGKNSIKVNIDSKKYFGEGITIFKDKIYQLTWQSGVGFVYDATTFKKIKEFKLPYAEGWGLTHNDTALIMSGGISKLFFLQPDSLTTQHMIDITDENGLVGDINELEYAEGYIYANKWQTPYILKIDPTTGKVLAKLDFTNTVNEVLKSDATKNQLNGIAYNLNSKTFFITGKNWPNIYELRIL
jgi:glutaminyl-peptide cyclotransferase